MPTKRRFLLSASFFLTLAILLGIFALRGIAPFGNASLLEADGQGQYVSYFALYRDLFSGKADWFYSFEKLLGGSLSGLFAYYLASPFNLLLLLFPRGELPLAMDLLILLKMSFCSLTMALYLDGTGKLSARSLVFTTAYALCGYNNAYAWCIMWLDAVILLPLVALGIERLWREGKPLLYIFSLGASILFCFYTGYMLCVFSVLYFLWRLTLDTVSLRTLPWKKIGRYALASLLGGGLSAGILLPGFLALSGGVPISPYYSVTRFTYPAALRMLAVLLPGRNSYDGLILPMLGLSTLFSLAAAGATVRVLFQDRQSLRRKVLSVCALLLLGLLWYLLMDYPLIREEFGFTQRSILPKFLVGYVPFWEFYNGSPNVYVGSAALLLCVSFFFNRALPGREKAAGLVLLLVLLASVSFYLPNLIWHGFEENNCFNYRYSFVVSFVLLILAERSFSHPEGISAPSLLAPAAVGLALTVALLLRPLWFQEPLHVFLAVGFLLMDLGALIFWRGGRRVGFAAVCVLELVSLCVSTGMSFYEQADHAAEIDLWRSSFLDEQARIDRVLEDKDGFYRIRKDGTRFNSNDPMLFSYPGLVHFSSAEKLDTIAFLGHLGLQTSPEYWANGDAGESRAADSLLGVRYYLGSEGIPGYLPAGDGVWANPWQLPLAFAAEDSAAGELTMNGRSCENLNTVFQLLTGKEQSIFLPAGAEELSLSVSSQEPLYFQNWSRAITDLQLYRNDELIRSWSLLRFPQSLYLGHFQPGDRLRLVLSSDKDMPIPLPVGEYLYYEDSAALAACAEQLRRIPCETVISTASRLETSVELDDTGLIIWSLPTDAGWQITVDGEPGSVETALGVLMAVRLGPGSHQIALRYTPPGLIPGVAISVLSLGLSLGWFLWLKKKARKAA